jgi:CBS domain-containing protein
MMEISLAGVAAEEEASKKKLQTLLEGTILKDIAPKRQVILAEKEQRVEEVLKIMASKQLIAIPVHDKASKKFVGMFDVLDLVALSLSVLDKKGDPMSEFHNMPIGKVINFSTVDVFAPMANDMSLYHLLETFTRGIHRVPLSDASGEVVNIVSGTNVIKFLADHQTDLGRAGAKTSTELGLGKKGVLHLETTATALDGFRMINQHKVEAIAIVEKDSLVGTLSASDLRGLTGNLVGLLSAPVLQFIKGQKPPETCRTNISLREAILILAKANAHRIWVVDGPTSRPVGVITQSDIMKAMLLSMNLTPRRKGRRSVDFGKLKLSNDKRPTSPTSQGSSGHTSPTSPSSLSPSRLSPGPGRGQDGTASP